MQKPLVSVIVPIYNAQNNIVRCVESIRRQTYENLEILLLNDGSKDVSYPVCEMLSKADARIVLIDKENSGVSATRNLGMRMRGANICSLWTRTTHWSRLRQNSSFSVRRITTPTSSLRRITALCRTSRKKKRSLTRFCRIKKKQLTEQLAKFQTFGFLPMGFMTKEEFACGLMQEPASF